MCLAEVAMRKIAFVIALFLALPAAAEDLSAGDIVKKASDGGTPDRLREKVTMTLIDAKGAATKRELSIVRGRAGKSAVWNTRMEFESPKDVAGTVLLSLGKAAGTADQYLYLPGLKRVRRIGGSQRSGSFQGSDFAYEDLTTREIESADYRKLADEKVGSDECWQVEATPKKGVDTGYGRTVADIRKTDFLTVRVRFLDAKGGALKTLDVDPAKLKIDGETRIPLHLEMKTAKDGHKTLLEVSAVEINPKIDEALFDPASLDKG